MKEIEVGGEIYEFPDQMQDDQIRDVLRKRFAPPEPAGPPTFTENLSRNLTSPDPLRVAQGQQDIVGKVLGMTKTGLEAGKTTQAEKERILREAAGVQEIDPLTKFASGMSSGISKGLRTPDKLLLGAADLILGATGAGDTDLGKGVEKRLKDYAAWEQRMSEQDRQMFGEGDIAGNLGEGVGRGAVELPLNMLPGAGAKTAAQAVTRAALAGGAVGGGTQYAQERGEGKGRDIAALQGLASGAITAATTSRFGATGVESIFREKGAPGLMKLVKEAAKEAGWEMTEETTDQFQQDLLKRITNEPNKPIADTLKELFMAGAVGGILGGGVSASRGAPSAAIATGEKLLDAYDNAQFESKFDLASQIVADRKAREATFPDLSKGTTLPVDINAFNREQVGLGPAETAAGPGEVESVALDPATGNPVASPAQSTLAKAAARLTEIQSQKAAQQAAAKNVPVAVEPAAPAQGQSNVVPEVKPKTGMELARALPSMSDAEFQAVAKGGFNRHNIELGLQATDAELDELKSLRDKMASDIADAKAKFENAEKSYENVKATPDAPPDQVAELKAFQQKLGMEYFAKTMRGSQFFNEAIRMAEIIRSENLKYTGKAGNRMQFEIQDKGPAYQAMFSVPDTASAEEISAKKQQVIKSFAPEEPSTSPEIQGAGKPPEPVNIPPAVGEAPAAPVEPENPNPVEKPTYKIREVVQVRLAKHLEATHKARILQIQPDGDIQVYIISGPHKKKSMWLAPELVRKPANVLRRAANEAEYSGMTPEQKRQSKEDLAEFKRLIKTEGPIFGWYDPTQELDPTKAGQIGAGNELKRAIEAAYKAIGISGDATNPVDIAKNLPKLKSYLENRNNFESAFFQGDALFKTKLRPDQLTVGDTLTSDEITVKVISKNSDGSFTVEGEKVGKQRIDAGQDFFADTYELEKPLTTEPIEPEEPAEPPKPPERPKPKTMRPLTKREQAEFSELTLKDKAARERGGPALTGDELRRYQALEALAGAQDLLQEDKGANEQATRNRIRQMREKAAELRRQGALEMERADNSIHRRDEFYNNAKRNYDEADKIESEANRMEYALDGDKARRDDLTLEEDENNPDQPPPPDDDQGTLFDRITQTPEPTNIFEMSDEDLVSFLETEFGRRERRAAAGLAARRTGTYIFSNFDDFKKWMDARYAERDLEGMQLAFAEADTKFKLGYIKATRQSAQHLKDWVAHLATGAPLPANDPPKARTTPRPGPDGRPVPGTGPKTPPPPPGQPGQSPPPQPPGGQSYQQPPPPPPRRPTHHRRFDTMALVQMLKLMNNLPRMNQRLRSAYGHYIPSSKLIELKARLFWDTNLAQRVLAHEIGHYIDLAIIASGKGKQVGERLRPLYEWKKNMGEKEALRKEAVKLSMDWRGPFTAQDQYRNDPNELFADFMSAMLNNPEWVNQHYPMLYDAFQDVRDAKPQFKSAYREIETWLQGDTMAQEFIDQQDSAVKRTMDELEKPKKASKASFMDRLKFGTVSLWGRAYQKEGKPRELGDILTDELEYNKMWAAKENALMGDEFGKKITPNLEKLDEDPVKARAALSAYSQAIRTIGERRAAGRWIEDNPAEARQILQMILEVDPTLASKWGGIVENAIDSQLYDVSAALFREMHDRGEEYVQRMMRRIDRLDLGVRGSAMMMAFNVRGKLLNPGGLTVENARKVIATFRNKLGPDKFNALVDAARELRNLMYQAQLNMVNEGLISRKVWNELIAPNRNSYLPYAVLDYFDGHVKAGVMPQAGTARDVADIAAATQLKIASINSWRQKQRQVRLLMEIYAKGGTPVAVGEKLDHASDIEDIRAKNKTDDISRAVIWRDGNPHLVEFPGDPGKLLESAMDNPAFYEHIGWITEASNVTHRAMQLYTQFSVPFLFWRNPVRGARTAALRTGFGRIAQQLTPAQIAENMKLARNYADAAFGADMLPEIRDLVDRQILLPPRLSQSMVRDADSLRQMLENNMILANEVRGTHVGKPAWWKGGEIGRESVILSEKVFTAYEAFEKIYNYKAAIEKGMTPAKAGAIARRGGIPNPGIGGKWSMAMEVWFPWTRVHLQGLRATYDIMRDPQLGKGFATRFAMTEALPRIAKVAIAMGIVGGAIKWITRDDEDENDGVTAEFLRRVSPYKMALDDTIPLYFYDPRTGKVHYLWEFKRGKDVPKHYEAVSFRIPASEEGRLWGVMMYQMMISAPGAREKIGQPGKGFVENMGSWAVNYLLPGVSPVIETSINLKDMTLLGQNPVDSYRGQPAANKQMFDAGGMDRAQAIAGYTLNQLGSAGELAGVMAANMGLMDERALKSMSARLPTDYKSWNEKIPFLKTAISHDNFGQYREEKEARLNEEQIRVKARLAMPQEARSIYDYYYRNIKRRDKLTDPEAEQFEVAKEFVNKVWGTMNIEGEPNPDSFYGKAAHVVGPDGSREAKETFKRDLEAAAAPYIADFMRINREAK